MHCFAEIAVQACLTVTAAAALQRADELRRLESLGLLVPGASLGLSSLQSNGAGRRAA